MTRDSPVIQVLPGFASHRVNPSLGCTQPCCPLPAWFHVDDSMGQVSLQGVGELVGNRGSDKAVPLSTQHPFISPLLSCGGRGYSLQTLLFSGHSSPQPFCSHSRMHPKAILPTLGPHLRKTKHAIRHAKTFFPALLFLWNMRFLKPALPFVLSLHNLSDGTSQNLSTIPYCTCRCPT